LYDPLTNEWSPAESTTYPRSGHTATALGMMNDKVLVAGGDVNGKMAELYDPASGGWSPAGNMVEIRYHHTATALPDGKVLVAGGCGGDRNFEILESTELYSPETNEWSAAGNMADARFLHTATALLDGKVLVAGGLRVLDDLSSAELYD
jgi:N-acetylneuraminic acid mutarotase